MDVFSYVSRNGPGVPNPVENEMFMRTLKSSPIVI